MREFTVTIRTLTPIWTGDAERKTTTLRETGIIGSLRWWYEALIRGLGGTACDPTSKDTKCNGENHCNACELFGCTGWARKFRLEVEFNNSIPEVCIGTREKRNKRYLKRNVSGLMSYNASIILRFIPLKEISYNEWALLNKTFEIITEYGALGARISQGNGVIKVIKNNLPHQEEQVNQIQSSKDERGPNLQNFSFYKFHITFKNPILDLIKDKVFWVHAADYKNFNEEWDKWEKLWEDYEFLPIAFHVRDSLRHLENDKTKRHNLFGELGKGSRVFVSHGYKIDDKTVEVRIWGYDIEDIKNKIKEELKDKLKEKLFSKDKDEYYLENCILKEEKKGEKILEELK